MSGGNALSPPGSLLLGICSASAMRGREFISLVSASFEHRRGSPISRAVEIQGPFNFSLTAPSATTRFTGNPHLFGHTASSCGPLLILCFGIPSSLANIETERLLPRSFVRPGRNSMGPNTCTFSINLLSRNHFNF